MPGRGTTCPHCGSHLSRLGLNDTMFDHEFDYACFNDDCPYYVRGWVWMEQQYGVKASYRDNHARLAQVKRKYDSGNLFRVNQNIKPA